MATITEILEKQQKAREFQEWQNERMLDAALLEGVNAGQTFAEFHETSKCPYTWAGRYHELQIQSGIAPGSVQKDGKADAFLEGFKHG